MAEVVVVEAVAAVMVETKLLNMEAEVVMAEVVVVEAVAAVMVETKLLNMEEDVVKLKHRWRPRGALVVVPWWRPRGASLLVPAVLM